MWWAAISTDIKKSSVNWATIPKWMQKSVAFHNYVLKQVMSEDAPDNIKIQLLPNSPEGDAFTWVFRHSDEQILREFVIRKAREMQFLLYQLRQDGSLKIDCTNIDDILKNEYKDIKRRKEAKKVIEEKDWYGGIYVRIGVAFSKKEPLSYHFERYGSTPKYKSYRGSIITLSEEAEKVAGFDLVPKYDETQRKTVLVAEITECYRNGNEIKFRKINRETIKENKCLMRTIRVINAFKNIQQSNNEIIMESDKKTLFQMVPEFNTVFELYQNIKTNYKENVKSVNKKGFIIFIHYKNQLNESMIDGAPYMKRYIQDEYRDIHNTANNILDKWKKDTNNKYKGGLIKQKRDDSSMYAFNSENPPNLVELQSLYSYMSILLSSLPKGSSIGICYGKFKEIEIKRNSTMSFYDYFGDSVNLAARMVMISWQYDTEFGKTIPNDKYSRLAFTTKYLKVSKALLNYLNSDKNTIPYMKEMVPLSSLNAGKNDQIVCISSKITSGSPYDAGEQMINFEKKEYKVVEDLGDKVVIENNGNNISYDKWRLKL